MHGLSLDAQKEALTEYANKNGMRIVDYYADEGITARKKLKNRKEFQRLMQDVEADKIDIILVTKLDRWFRNIKDYHNTQEILEEHNCNWKTIFENYDTSTAAGRLHINIMLSVNQDESDRTSERIKAVFKHKLQNKEIISGTLPVGYTKDGKHLVPDPDTAQMIQDIYNYYEMCNSVRKTLLYVNENYDFKVYDYSMRRILSDPIYKGDHKAGIKDFCPAIIDETQWDNVQRLLKINHKHYPQKGEKSTYIFSGMIKCKECGARMTGSRRMVGGNVYKQYRCQYHASGLCTNKYVIPEKGGVEKYLLNNVKEELKKYKVSFDVTAKEKPKTDKKAKIAKLKRKIDKLKDLYLDDLIDKDTYKSDYTDLSSQLEALTVEQGKVDVDLSAVNALLSLDFEHIYQTLSDDEKRFIWLSVIDYIEVGTCKSDITLHFR